MAEIKFTGIVERLLGGKGVKVVENHRIKNAAGEWETKGRTYFTVWLGECKQPAEGSLIEVTGRQKTVAEEYNGTTRYNLHVAAATIKVVSVFTKESASISEPLDVPSSWTELSNEPAPF